MTSAREGREARIEEIRAKIEAGAYQVDSLRLARVLINRHILRKPD